jgi:predicted aspartyl protease
MNTKIVNQLSISIIILISSCGTTKLMKYQFEEKVSPAAFKVTVPFIHPKNDRLFIPVFFEKENTTRTLLFDSHAPFCIFNSIIATSKAFRFVAKSNIDKGTPDGKKIDNVFYLTDSVKLGNISFNHVLVNGLPDYKDTAHYNYDGIFGDNLIIKGIWKIDFEHQILTMASSIDSISGLNEAKKIPARLNYGYNFNIDVAFDNNITERMEVDLGYNGFITMPKTQFFKIDSSRKAIIKEGQVTSASGTQATKQYVLENVDIKIGSLSTHTKIISSDVMRKKYLGLGFFAKYKFVIFDYLNKSIYLSNETL